MLILNFHLRYLYVFLFTESGSTDPAIYTSLELILPCGLRGSRTSPLHALDGILHAGGLRLEQDNTETRQEDVLVGPWPAHPGARFEDLSEKLGLGNGVLDFHVRFAG